jgi:Domain of unknown function (DUF4279)
MGKVHVSLRLLSGEKSPDQIFVELGVPADNSWRTGERRGKTSLIEKENGYEFRSGQPGDISLEEQVHSLLHRLEPIASKVRSIGCEVVQLTCVVYASRMPSIHFSSSAIEMLDRLGASIDVDLYVEEGNWEE